MALDKQQHPNGNDGSVPLTAVSAEWCPVRNTGGEPTRLPKFTARSHDGQTANRR
ncbi:hypothetical protein ZHAS_00010348 [Anopheles sinensis]|uniref:Uncharacterized protein n=1 Tax=Anopheles sinensis TaxID=74873 RepID=A0A084VXC9_ANOSI|nr:hypothetical protein ZHAS_00010348 [Anopheles sinensis]